MSKAAFGEYGAFHTQGGVRFQKNNKLVSEVSLPTEVVSYLRKSLGEDQAQIVPPPKRFPMPTPEEKARLRAESLQVKPELQVNPAELPLTSADFDVEIPSEPVLEALTTNSGTFPGQDEPKLEAPAPAVASVDSDFLESVSIHTAPLADIAQALLARFGIYTVYMGTLPNHDEINPLTGELFTKYHLGIAYQAAIRAQNTGLLSRSAEEGRKMIDEGRYASANLPLDAPAQTMGQARRENTYEFRTSTQGTDTVARTEIMHEMGADGLLHAVQRNIPDGETGQFNGATAKFDVDEDEPLVQPNFSGKPVIRPNW